MQLPEVVNSLSTTQVRICLEIALGLLFTMACAIATFVFRQSREFFAGMDTKLDVIKDNHLTHIEAYTGKSAETLQKLLESHELLNTRLAEMNAYLKVSAGVALFEKREN